MKANSLTEEQIAYNHANTVKYYLDFIIIPYDNNSKTVQQASSNITLALTEARGLSKALTLHPACCIHSHKQTYLSFRSTTAIAGVSYTWRVSYDTVM